MKNKIIIGIIVVVLIGGYFMFSNNFSGGGFAGSILPLSANISSSVEIGPDEDNRVFASSTRRVYASLMVIEAPGISAVYCEANGDAAATSGEGILLASTTSRLYEFTSDKGNLFAGSLRCTATASTTVLIQQFIVR